MIPSRALFAGFCASCLLAIVACSTSDTGSGVGATTPSGSAGVGGTAGGAATGQGGAGATASAGAPGVAGVGGGGASAGHAGTAAGQAGAHAGAAGASGTGGDALGGAGGGGMAGAGQAGVGGQVQYAVACIGDGDQVNTGDAEHLMNITNDQCCFALIPWIEGCPTENINPMSGILYPLPFWCKTGASQDTLPSSHPPGVCQVNPKLTFSYGTMYCCDPDPG